jgi:hypothetical protein
MNSRVKVTANDKGQVVAPSENNSEYGHIRVTQDVVSIDERTGFVRKKMVSALIPGLVEDLKSFGWVNGQTINGKIVVRESLEAFNPNDPERDLKYAGDTGVICTLEGQPIFRKSFYTLNENAQDEKIQHDNTAEILAARSNSALTPNKVEFDI